MTQAATHPVYAIVGADRFLRGIALEKLLQVLDDGPGVARFEGDHADIREVLDDVRTPSLLGGRRTVVVDDADDFITAHRPTLEKYCSAPSPDGCLVLLCDSMPSNTKLYKVIDKTGQVIKAEPLKGKALQDWIVRRAREAYGKRLSEDTARNLRDLIGDAPGWLDSEVAKLAAFVGGRAEITHADVEAATGQSREEKVFAVVDAMAVGDTANALRLWDQVWATDRAAPGRAIAGLAWSVRRLLEARCAWEKGEDVYPLSRKLFTDPATLMRRFEQMSAARLHELQRGLMEADLAVKTGASTVDVAIEKLIVRFATTKGLRAKAG